MPSALTAFFVSRVMTRAFLLKIILCSSLSLHANQNCISDIFCLVNIDGSVCIYSCRDASWTSVGSKGVHISKILENFVGVSFQSRGCLALVISLFYSPEL